MNSPRNPTGDHGILREDAPVHKAVLANHYGLSGPNITTDRALDT